jgi:hypothetical protein
VPVPHHLTEVQDPDWLTAAMQASTSGCRVVGVDVVEDIRVVATKADPLEDEALDDPGEPK